MSVKSTLEYDSITYHYTTLRPIIQLLRIIGWKKDYTRQSITLILLWTFFWLHTALVAYTIPIWIIVACYHGNANQTRNNDTKTQYSIKELTDELNEIQLELSLLLPTWIILLNVFGIGKIIWFIGSFILTWNSPLVKVIRYSSHQVQFLFRQPTKQIIKSSTKPNSMTHANDHLDRFYRFVIVEHQRWWLHCGWTSLLLPNERPKWSDQYLSKVPSTLLFHLPPPTTKLDKLTNKIIQTTWQWISPEWQIDEDHNVDTDGWEYGSWDWKRWNIKSSGLRVLTRRRHWVRSARLVKEEITNDNTTLPINIKTSNTAFSISTSLSSEDSFMCTTPTASPTSLHTKSISTSTFNQPVEPTLFSDHHSTIDSQIWLRR
ncbi:hypothetical protein INT48_006254 [Thamnidium elegans]|uniref:TECPR1-like DysF domain-containing protein n=1 Tax=Thamnidium elegans TaxID=101142 RepID=A0A8H7SHY8_9FUNG|nr:hypothetical protein INT48_006254 [Thamnidium elegans]